MERHIIKKISLIFILFIFLVDSLLTLGTESVKAAPVPLDIQIEASYEGRIKENHWFPVKFTITNPGDEVSGDLVVDIASQSNGKNVAYVKSLELPENSTNVVWMALPGISLHKNNHSIQFHKDSVGGERIKLSQGPLYIETSFIPPQALQIGVLSSDKDTLNFLTLLNQSNYQVHVIHLDQEDLPDESLMLDGLDIIAINDFSSDQLTEKQVKAIDTWVKQGGKLILSGGASYPKSAQSFLELSPVEYQGTLSLEQLPALTEKVQRELNLSTPFTVSKGELLEGQIMIAEDNTPIFASKEVGKGSVLYVAYDLSLNPLASWNGNSMIWEQVLSDALEPINSQGTMNYGNNYWEIDQALDYFPDLLPPALGTMLWIFLGYIVIAAPLLYFFLKRWDKRELAWVIIPTIAIISSLSIFALGAADRSSTLSQTLNVIELSGDGHGSKQTAASVFVPTGGKYEIELAEHQYAAPFQNDFYYGSRNELEGSIEQLMFVDKAGPRIQFRDVPFWSIRKMWIYDGETQEYGKFEYDVSFDSSGMKGEITNLTEEDLKDIILIMNSQFQRIGDMKAGETRDFQLAFNLTSGFKQDSLPQMIYPYHGNQDTSQQERALLTWALNQKSEEGRSNVPLIIALNENQKEAYTIDGKSVVSNQTNLWLQEIILSYTDGDKVFIPYGHIHPIMSENSLNYMNVDSFNQTIEIGQGAISFDYRLPQIAGAEYSRFMLSANIPASGSLDIWNHSQQAWITYNAGQFQGGLGADFIDGHKIRMRFNNNQDHMIFHYPEISVEGTVNP